MFLGSCRQGGCKLHRVPHGKWSPALLLNTNPPERRALDGELYFFARVLGFPASMPAGLEPPAIDNVVG